MTGLCSCDEPAEWVCYRCGAPLCSPCSHQGGGWCKQCNQDSAAGRPPRKTLRLGGKHQLST